VWDSDDSSVSEDLKMTIGQYLEHIRNKLLVRELVFAEELGLISV
jgi:hypothetical protein